MMIKLRSGGYKKKVEQWGQNYGWNGIENQINKGYQYST